MEKQNIYAKLYTDGSLILSSYDYTDTNKQIRHDYGKTNNLVYNEYVKSIVVWDHIILPDYSDFRHMDNVEKMDLRNLDTSHVEDMSLMFCGCTKLKKLNITNLDTSNVRDMSRMFDGCSSLENIDLTNFNTSRVKDMSRMFFKCSRLKEINLTGFDTSNVESMNMMFYGCSNLENIDLTSFNTSNVESMGFMFNNCSSLKNLDLTNFNTSNVKDMERMFYGCSSIKNLDLTNFNTSNVEDMNKMFCKCLNLERIHTSNFDTANVTDMDNIFKSCDNLKNVAIRIKSEEEIAELIRKNEEAARKQEEEILEQERIRKEHERIKREEIKIAREKNRKEKILRDNMIIDAYKKGQSIKLITEDYDISHNTVKNILVRNGIGFRYDTIGRTNELNEYYKQLYEWLEKNHILFKPNDRTTLKVSVDALLLGDYSNIAIHISEKPKYMSEKKYKDNINLKISKAKKVGFNIIFLNKEHFKNIDNIKELLDNLKLENERNFRGFKGIVISKNDISKYQKLYYALAIKDVFSKDISELEYNTGEYLDIDEFENLIQGLPEKWEKVYRYYNSLDGKKYTNIEIGQKVGISEQQVKQIIEKLKEGLTRPYIKRKYENEIIRDYKKDCEKVEEYNSKINNLRQEIEDLQIISNYFSNEDYKDENIKLSNLKVNIDKIEKLKEENINNIQDLIKKYYIEKNDPYVWELDLSARTNNCLRRSHIEKLSDLLNLTENELRKIRMLGDSSYKEIIDKLFSMGVKLKEASEEINEITVDFWDLVVNDWDRIKEYFIYNKKIKVEQLEESINKRDSLVLKIKKYNNAIKQYLNNYN